MTILFIGGGNMATAIAGGLIARGRAPSGIAFVDPVEAQRAKLAAAFPGAQVHAAATADTVTPAKIVVLAVKPQQMREACAALAPHVAGVPVVLSIAAGTRSTDISRWLGGYARIVRAMPDTPSLVGAGIAGVWSSPTVGAEDRASASAILEACGEVVPVDREEMLDAVTGVSASGVAYVFYFIEALEAAARAQGFDANDARRLAYATFAGAVKLAVESPDDPATLRERVTSKGGTTERGIAALEAARVREAIGEAVDAATRRATEMGEILGRG
ncbi:pyrroline-5-carboxylate reductase [Burkholderiales bacterium]|nr:pyrroline-5-carboxylate reductase [Burkholderiales bacterium]